MIRVLALTTSLTLLSSLLAQTRGLSDYTFFLNKIAQEDTFHFYDASMAGLFPASVSIVRLGIPGSYFYQDLLLPLKRSLEENTGTAFLNKVAARKWCRVLNESKSGENIISLASEEDATISENDLTFSCTVEDLYQEKRTTLQGGDGPVDSLLQSNQLLYQVVAKNDTSHMTMVPPAEAAAETMTWMEWGEGIAGTLALSLGIRHQGHMLERPLEARELARVFHTDRDEEAAQADGGPQALPSTGVARGRLRAWAQHPSGFPVSAVDEYEISGLVTNHDLNAVTPRITNGKIGIARASPRTSLFAGFSSHDVGYRTLPGDTLDLENQNDQPLALNRSQDRVPPLRKNLQDAIHVLQRPNSEVSDTVLYLQRHCHAPSEFSRNTMALLRCFHFIDFKNCYKTLPSVNTSRDWRDKPFILNTSVPLFSLTIRSDDRNKSMITIIPAVVTAAIKSNIDSAGYVANRTPNAQENRQVRGIILDTFIDYYGKEIAVTCFSNLLSEENKSTPITAGDLQQVFAKLDALSIKENTPVGRFIAQRSKKLEGPLLHDTQLFNLSNAFILKNDNLLIDLRDQSALELRSKAANNNLLHALSYGTETLARGCGVGIGTIGGALAGALDGSLDASLGGTLFCTALLCSLVWGGDIPFLTYVVRIFVLRTWGRLLTPLHGALHTTLKAAVAGAFFGVVGDALCNKVHTLTGACIGAALAGGACGSAYGGAHGAVRAYHSFAPQDAWAKTVNAFSDFRNQKTFKPKALTLLKEAQQQDHERAVNLNTFFDHLPSEAEEKLHSEHAQELTLARIFHTDSAAACEHLMDTASASNCSSGSMKHTAVVAIHNLPCHHQDSQRLATNQYEICGLTTPMPRMRSVEGSFTIQEALIPTALNLRVVRKILEDHIHDRMNARTILIEEIIGTHDQEEQD